MSLPVEITALEPATPPLAVIFGLLGTELTQEEHDFFRRVQPLGFILFSRNIDNPQQLSALTKSLKDCVQRDVPILVDQEGGRVARLCPPHFPSFPAAGVFGERADEKGVLANAHALADMLRDAGINVNCTPVLDVVFPDTHDVIGVRAFSSDPALVGVLGASVCKGHLEKGIFPVVKHMPGQGRATMDSHTHLPVVTATMAALEAVDFLPYRYILQQDFAGAIWGMVSHIVYTAIDPHKPATCSHAVTDGVIRQAIGFDGFLLSDDIVMNALSVIGDMGQRGAEVLAAGCDAVLHCSGDMEEMAMVAAAIPALSAESVRRFNDSLVAAGLFQAGVYNTGLAPVSPPPATPEV